MTKSTLVTYHIGLVLRNDLISYHLPLGNYPRSAEPTCAWGIALHPDRLTGVFYGVCDLENRPRQK